MCRNLKRNIFINATLVLLPKVYNNFFSFNGTFYIFFHYSIPYSILYNIESNREIKP